jgi:hypothetical protein
MSVIADELIDRIRLVVREEVQEGVAGLATHQEPEGYFSTESAARYLDTTAEAIRSACKHGKLTPFKRGEGRNARLSFTRDQLDAFARGEAA